MGTMDKIKALRLHLYSMSESAPGESADGCTEPSDKDSSHTCRECGKEYNSHQGLGYHYKSDGNDCTGLQCPICGRATYSTMRGVRMHKAREHDVDVAYDFTRLADREWFYKQYVMNGKSTSDIAEIVGCSNSRARAWKRRHNIPSITAYKNRGEGNENPNGDRYHIECETCGEELSRPKSKIEQSDNQFCSRDCLNEWQSNQTGEDNPLYEGGPIGYYGEGWHKTRKRRLELDDHECQRCGCEENLEVHHIKPVREFDEPSDAHYIENLITLCTTCHREWEGIPLRPITHE